MNNQNCPCGGAATQSMVFKTRLLAPRPPFKKADVWNQTGFNICDKCSTAMYTAVDDVDCKEGK